MFSTKPNYSSVKELFSADESVSLEDSSLDEQLWLLLCERICKPSDLKGLSPEVGHYYASRLVQWEIGNGGFAQAADNVPDWLSCAAAAYDVLGKSDFANLIRQANAIILKYGDDLDMIGEECEALDDQLAEVDWEIDEVRIEYVRANKEAFLSF